MQYCGILKIMKTALLYVTMGVVTAVAVVLAILAPIGLVGIAGIVVAIALAARPKLLAGITVLGGVFVATFTQISGIETVDYLDDALILLLLASVLAQAAVTKKPLRWLPGTTWFLIFAIAASVSALVQEVQFSLAATDAFLLLKGLIAAFAIAQIDWKQSDLAKIARVGAVVIVLILAGAAVNFVIPETWNALFAQAEVIRQRGSIPVLISFFGHPSMLAQIMAIAAVSLFIYRQVVRKSPATLILLMATTVTAFATFRRKTAVGLVIAFIAVNLRTRTLTTVLCLILATPLLLLLFGDALVNVVNEAYTEFFGNVGEAARTVLYQGAVTVANDNFPLGVGFAQYGGFVAGSNYSPIYYELGFPYVWGLQPGGRFMTDTFWPAVIGEAGWFGGAAYAVGLFILTAQGFSLSKAGNEPHTRWFGFLAVALSIEFALESIAAPVYSSPPSYLILFGVFGVCASLRSQKKEMPHPLSTKYEGRNVVRFNGTVSAL